MKKKKISFKFFRKDDRPSVYLYASGNGSKRIISTGIKCREDEFVEGEIIPKTEDGRIARQSLEDLRSLLSCVELHPFESVDVVSKVLKGTYKHTEHLFTLMNAIYYGYEATKPNLSKGSIKTYDSIIKSFERFMREELGYDDIISEMINPSIGTRYKNWLIETLSATTIVSNLNVLSSMYNTYIEDHNGIENNFPVNPFPIAARKMKKAHSEEFKRNRRDIHNNTLNNDQIEIIENFKFHGSKKHTMNRWRLTMLWQIYTGFSLADLCHYNWKIVDTRSGRFIELFRKKTGNRCVIPFTEDCERVYDKLMENRIAKSNLLFPMAKIETFNQFQLESKKYARAIKKFSEMIDIPMTSHLFRHTFGMRMSEKGIPLNHIARMMGHSSVKTTESFYVQPKDEEILRSVQNELV